jgi:predicted glycoside hydrolase/deacetylase ChbG (UPF0249 family)
MARTDHFIGLVGSGKKNYFNAVQHRIGQIERAGADVSVEVLCHPGYVDEALIEYGDEGWNRGDDYKVAILIKQNFPDYIWIANET